MWQLEYYSKPNYRTAYVDHSIPMYIARLTRNGDVVAMCFYAKNRPAALRYLLSVDNPADYAGKVIP